MRPVFRSAGGGGWPGVALEPFLDDVVIELLRPKHAGQRLAVNGAVFAAQAGGFELVVKLVRFLASLRDEPIEIVERQESQVRLIRCSRSRTELDSDAADREPVMRRGLRSHALRIYGVRRFPARPTR